MIPAVGMEKKKLFSPFCPRERFFGVVSHLTRDLYPFYQALCFFFHTSSIHGVQFGTTVKTKPK